MPREVDVLGVYFPSLLIAFLGVVPVFLLLDGVLARLGCYRWVWHIDVFRLSLFLALFCSVGLYWYR
jgi:protein AaeX